LPDAASEKNLSAKTGASRKWRNPLQQRQELDGSRQKGNEVGSPVEEIRARPDCRKGRGVYSRERCTENPDHCRFMKSFEKQPEVIRRKRTDRPENNRRRLERVLKQMLAMEMNLAAEGLRQFPATYRRIIE